MLGRVSYGHGVVCRHDQGSFGSPGERHKFLLSPATVKPGLLTSVSWMGLNTSAIREVGSGIYLTMSMACDLLSKR